ncbi:hypothetical protein OEIGOIKO_00647 [Streptomyces chrestomyceticus JCM 4735]|uniref:Uncharacterized protein n=1 Tax=Streptomyces chrestomyceticus JCM 4735 TaxID=1306181 RepID=A0A7U9KPE4_9ACTN|nr:hypothetical protein [Streptomyces chrestomyceticus]GCD32929.1 hypothetical protein OEIGOIKO_00647 [Streptomyces chrestomyceticus JCM 4735]
MDPITTAVATALVGAMATDAWRRVTDAVVALWRRAHPERADGVGAELAGLRDDVLAVRAQPTPDPEAEQALITVWQGRLARLVDGNAELRAELQRLLAEDLTPLLPRAEQEHVTSIRQIAQADRRSKVVQAGDNVIIHGDL